MLIYPNYDKCILNYIAAIRKVYGKTSEYTVNEDFYKLLLEKEYKNIIILLLDGLGVNILNKHLDNNSFLKRHLYDENISIYPSTTAASTTATKAGLAPIVTGWTGWENYFKEINRNVILFTGNNYVTDEPTGLNVYNFLPYKMFYDDLMANGVVIEPDFSKSNYSIKELLKRSLKACKSSNIQYVYFSEPDGLLHEYGTDSDLVNQTMKIIDKEIENYFNKLPCDSMLVISADHGHIDCSPIDFYKNDELLNMLERRPSNDSRCISFKVKKEFMEAFPVCFNKFYKDKYLLYKSEDLIDKEFFGTKKDPVNARIFDFLGDYVGIAIGDRYFNYKGKNAHVFKSHHAGITKEEMIVPVIIAKK